MHIESEPTFGSLVETAAQDIAWIAPERTTIGRVDVAEDTGDAPVGMVFSARHDLERACVGTGEHVGFLNAGESLDRGAVEADSLVERLLELLGCDREALEKTEDVGEPEPHQPDAPFLARTQHVLLLPFHLPAHHREPTPARFPVGYMLPRPIGWAFHDPYRQDGSSGPRPDEYDGRRHR